MDFAIRPLLLVCVAGTLTSCGPEPTNVVLSNERAGTEAHTEIRTPALDLDFGTPPLGSTVSAIPSAMRRSANCYEAAYIDCEYRDESDVQYLVYGHTLTRKRIVIDGRARPGLPFGLRGDETVDQALQALNARFGSVFTRYEVEGRTGLASPTLRNQSGYEYSAQIVVGPDGKLEEISVGGIAE
jgi:hypothetical protein